MPMLGLQEAAQVGSLNLPVTNHLAQRMSDVLKEEGLTYGVQKKNKKDFLNL